MVQDIFKTNEFSVGPLVGSGICYVCVKCTRLNSIKFLPDIAYNCARNEMNQGHYKPKTSFLKLPLQVYHRRTMKQAPLFDTHLAIEVLQDGGFDARQAKKRLSRLWTDL